MVGMFSNFKRLFIKSASNQDVVTPQSKSDLSTGPVAPTVSAIVDPGTITYNYSRKNFYRLLLPGDQYDTPVTVPQKLVADILRNSLKQAEDLTNFVPRLPSVVPKLLRSLRDPDASSRDFVDIIRKDPAITAAVLKLANSVYFNPVSKSIADIDVAVVKLGINGLRAVLSAAVLQPVLDKRSPYFSGFGTTIWHHSLHCAVVAEQLAGRYKLEPFKAYLLGLVHDSGKITLFSELCRQMQKNGGNEAPGVGAFLPLLTEYSLSLSYEIAKDWRLPEDLCAALKQQLNFTVGDQVSPYARVLAEANLIAEQYAMWQAGESPEEVCRQLLKKFELPANMYDRLAGLSVQV